MKEVLDYIKEDPASTSRGWKYSQLRWGLSDKRKSIKNISSTTEKKEDKRKTTKERHRRTKGK